MLGAKQQAHCGQCSQANHEIGKGRHPSSLVLVKLQAQFASAAAEPFVAAIRQMVANGDLRRRHLAFGLRAISDSIQFAIIGDEKREFVARTCSQCDTKSTVDVRHLFQCQNGSATDRRHQLTLQLLDIVSRVDTARAWLQSFRKASFLTIVRNMFSCWDKHFVDDDARCFRCAFGCFSHQELDTALSAMCVPPDDRQWYRIRTATAAADLRVRRVVSNDGGQGTLNLTLFSER